MSAEKHTPGPWERRWSYASDGERTEETGRIEHPRFGIICHLVMADDVDANARLIAAAPDLLEALVMAETLLDLERPAGPRPCIREHEPRDHHEDCRHCRWALVIDTAQRAIGKATKRGAQ